MVYALRRAGLFGARPAYWTTKNKSQPEDIEPNLFPISRNLKKHLC